MDNRNQLRVPPCVHKSVVEALDRLDEKSYNNIHKFNSARKVLLIAACCVVAVVFMTGAAIFLTDREQIEKRETELVDPYAEQVMESVTDNGITMTLNKLAADYHMDYVYFTLKNENGVFEKQPEFDEITFDWIYYSKGIETKYGSLLGFTTLSVSDYDPENPSDTIHAVLRHPLPFGKMTLNFKGLKSTDGTIEYADGFSFDINIGTSEKLVNDLVDNSGFPEDAMRNELKQYDMKSEALDYQTIELDKTIEIEGCELKATSLYISPYQISVSVKSDLSKTVKIGELKYYPVTLISISTDYLRKAYERNEYLKTATPDEIRMEKERPEMYVFGDWKTKAELDYEAETWAEHKKLYDEQGQKAAHKYLSSRDIRKTDIYKEIESIRQNPEYFDMLDAASYKIGVDFATGTQASLIGVSHGQAGSTQEYATAFADAYIDRPVSIDEIERIYLYKYSDPSVQVDIWTNK